MGEKLGFGAFALVFACARSDRPGDFSFAHKRLQNDVAQLEAAVKRFEREVEILRALNHPNVMTVVDSGVSSKGVPWLVMPKASSSLEQMLTNPFTDYGATEWASRIMLGVLSGMAHAHERGVLHRDVKPQNILMFGTEPRISDFGIAKNIDIDQTRLTKTADELGTVRYMAPEQLSNARRATKASDVFSLGKVFAYMLTGVKPDVGAVDVSSVPERFRFFVSKCCRESPAGRYPDAGAALAALETLMNPEEMVMPTLDQAKALVAAAVQSRNVADLDALDEHLARHADDQELQREVVPRLPPAVVASYLTQRPERLRETVRAFDAQLDDGMSFGYCDVVADFYGPIFKQTNDIELLELVMERLIVMGRRHNRFYVHDVVVKLLGGIKDDVRSSVAADVISRNPHEAGWFAERALQGPLRTSVANALRAAAAEYENLY